MAHSVFTAFTNVQRGMRYKQESHTLTILPRIDFTVAVVKLALLPDSLRFRFGHQLSRSAETMLSSERPQ